MSFYCSGADILAQSKCSTRSLQFGIVLAVCLEFWLVAGYLENRPDMVLCWLAFSIRLGSLSKLPGLVALRLDEAS